MSRVARLLSVLAAVAMPLSAAAAQEKAEPGGSIAAGAGKPLVTAQEPAAAAATEPAPAAPTRPAAAGTAAKPAFALDMARAIGRIGTRIEARDRTALQAFYSAREGAPIWVAETGRTAAAKTLLAELGKADTWGLDPAAYATPSVRADGAADRGSEQLALEEAEISAAVLRYARHAVGGRVDPLALTKFLDRKPTAYDGRSVLEQIATAAEPDQYLRDLHPRHPQFQALRKAYLSARDSKEKGANPRRLLANLEQWRWMPQELGDYYVWVNVPEFTIRVVSGGKVVHSERVIVGKVDTQTPIFSDEMEQVIFHPFWGVPDSIKQNEVLPSLRGNGAVLAKHNLRVQIGGRDVDPRSVDWSKADIRKAHVYQPPGRDNVLGVVKFRFPNKHDVYMHDTPTKSLFQQNVRAYSHGCMRVQNPVRLAELILAEDRQMSSDRVRAMTVPGAPENNQINLTRRVPVHITYFTASVDDDGQVKTFADLYGHEERIGLGLEGKMHLVKPVPEPKGSRAEPVASLSEQWFGGFGSGGSSGGGRGDWANRAFSNN